MKKLLLITCLSLSISLSFAKIAKRQTITIADDGITLVIKIKKENGVEIKRFSKSFDIKNRNFIQRDFIVLNAFESVKAKTPIHELKGSVFSWTLFKIFNYLID